jgi:hypothetical protein
VIAGPTSRARASRMEMQHAAVGRRTSAVEPGLAPRVVLMEGRLWSARCSNESLLLPPPPWSRTQVHVAALALVALAKNVVATAAIASAALAMIAATIATLSLTLATVARGT